MKTLLFFTLGMGLMLAAFLNAGCSTTNVNVGTGNNNDQGIDMAPPVPDYGQPNNDLAQSVDFASNLPCYYYSPPTCDMANNPDLVMPEDLAQPQDLTPTPDMACPYNIFTTPNQDHDGDGYTPAEGDTDDCDPNIHPMSCTGTHAMCGGSCRDLANDPNNCGSCFTACNTLYQYCGNGQCIGSPLDFSVPPDLSTPPDMATIPDLASAPQPCNQPSDCTGGMTCVARPGQAQTYCMYQHTDTACGQLCDYANASYSQWYSFEQTPDPNDPQQAYLACLWCANSCGILKGTPVDPSGNASCTPYGSPPGAYIFGWNNGNSHQEQFYYSAGNAGQANDNGAPPPVMLYPWTN